MLQTHIQPFVLFVICCYLVVTAHCCESMTHRFTAVGAVTCDHKITSLPKVIWEECCVAVLSHMYAVKSPLVTIVHPKFAPKVPLPVDWSPNRTTCLIPGPVRPMMPNGTRIRFAILPQCTGQTNQRMYVRESLMTMGCCTMRTMQPNNR